MKKHPLKVPGNTCREHTPALWSVNSLLWSWEEEAVKEWRKEMTRLGQDKKKHNERKGRAQQDIRVSCLILWKIKFTPKTVKRKINSLDPE